MAHLGEFWTVKLASEATTAECIEFIAAIERPNGLAVLQAALRRDPMWLQVRGIDVSTSVCDRLGAVNRKSMLQLHRTSVSYRGDSMCGGAWCVHFHKNVV